MSKNNRVTVCSCVIGQLKLKHFRLRTTDFQLAVVKAGRPQPKLKELVKNSQNGYVRHFNPSMYTNHMWMVGCETFKKLYCWPCLMFSSDSTNWTKNGHSNLTNIHISAIRHGKGKPHIEAVLSLKEFEQRHIGRGNSGIPAKECHSTEIKDRKRVLKRLTLTTCYLGSHEDSFHSSDEDTTSGKHYVYVDYKQLHQLLAGYDGIIKRSVDVDNLFVEPLSDVQRGIMECTSRVLTSQIKEDIGNAKFFAVLLNVHDVCGCPCLSTVVRYLTECGEVKDHFLGFVEISKDTSPDLFAKYVNEAVDSLNCKDKLTTATVTSVETKHPFAQGFTGALQSIITQSVKQISECEVFFGALNSMTVFFLCSKKHMRCLKKFLNNSSNRAIVVDWGCSHSRVTTVLKYRNELLAMFNHMWTVDMCLTDNDITVARGFTVFLNDLGNCFLLNVFSEIFKLVEDLVKTLRTDQLDINFWKKVVERAKEHLTKIRNGYSVRLVTAQKMCDISEEDFRRNRHQKDLELKLRKLHDEIFDNVWKQINARFEGIDDLKFLELLNCSRFAMYANDFPTDALITLHKSYSHHLDAFALKSELNIVYSRVEYRAFKSVVEFSKYLRECDIEDVLPQFSKLCNLVLMILSTLCNEKRSTMMERVYSYARNATLADALSPMAVLTIENNTLASRLKASCRSKFCKAVITEYAATHSLQGDKMCAI